MFALISLVTAAAFARGALGNTDNPVLVVVGDSWGSYGWHDLQEVLKDKGSNLTVKSYARPGTTTADWAKKPDLVNQIVTENPTTAFVWLTIGGNDVIDFMPDCTKTKSVDDCVNIILPEAINNTQTFMDPMFADHPDMQVVQFGYDLPNLDENVMCRSIGEDIIYGCNGTASCINPQFSKIQYLYVDAMAKKYPNNLQSVNLLGSLQAADNYPGVSITKPDLSKWSPADLMESNCIHPTRDDVLHPGEPAGFKIIFENLWDAYFAKQ